MPKADLDVVLAGIEFLVAVFGLTALFVRGWHKYYKAMAVYLIFRLVSGITVMPIFERAMQQESGGGWHWIMGLFWIQYLVAVGLVLVVYGSIIEMMFPALRKTSVRSHLGLLWMIAFFGVILFALSTRLLGDANRATAFESYFMQSVSILELSMLAFLTIGRRALGITMKDMSYGIALGFAALAMINLLHTINGMRFLIGGSQLEAIYHLLSIAALCVWGGYAVQPVKRRAPVLLPLRTMLKRWNEIATAMGHKETQVVMPRQAGFLKDVERIVDRAFQENFK